MLELPLSGAIEGSLAQGTGADEGTNDENRRLRTSSSATMAVAVLASRTVGDAKLECIEADGATGRRLQTKEYEGSSDGAERAKTSPVGAIETIVWVTSSGLLGLLVLVLLVPEARPCMHAGLQQVDIMATAHTPDQYAAVRRINTPAGGLFTAAAAFAALAASSSLVFEYAYRN